VTLGRVFAVPAIWQFAILEFLPDPRPLSLLVWLGEALLRAAARVFVFECGVWALARFVSER